MSISEILEETNTEKYCIEYRQFLTNHIAHGIIALHRLGAPKDRIQKFVDWYKDRLEKPEKEKDTTGDVESLKGKRVSYYKILYHFQDLLKEKYKTIDDLIAGEFPKYSLGLGCSALHGTIHLGYGYSARNERRVCEGLAYLHHSYLPLVHTKPLPSSGDFGKGGKSPVEILQSLNEDKEFHLCMIGGIKKEPWVSMNQGYFQPRLAYLLTAHGDHLVSLLSDIKLDVPQSDNGDIHVMELGKLIVDIAIKVYVMAKPMNDFFLLHGVTCAWSILKVLPVLSAAHALEIIQVFLVILMATYVCQDCPTLSTPLSPRDAVDSKQWDDIIARVLAMTVDEHIYKLVQVVNDMWKLQPDMGHVYVQAAETAINNPLSFLK